jgi:hypothetical protein
MFPSVSLVIYEQRSRRHRSKTKIQGATGLLLPSSPPSPPGYCSKRKRARVDFQSFHPGYGGWIRRWGNREGLLFAGED